MEKLIEAVKSEISKRKIKADIYLEENTRTEVAVNDGSVDRISQAVSFGMGLRIFKDSKMGFGFSTVKTAAQAAELMDKTEKNARAEGYAAYEFGPAFEPGKINMADPGYLSVTMEQRKARALSMEASVKKSSGKIKSACDTTCVDNYSRIFYLNSAGAQYNYEKTYSFAFTSAVATDGRSDEVVDAMEGSVIWNEVDADKAGALAGEKAAGLLSGGPVKSGRYNLIIPPAAAVEFLQVISPMFSGANLRKGKTLLMNVKKGEKIGADMLSIVDNPLMDNRIGSYPADGEGVRGFEKEVISAGAFGTFLYDMVSGAHFKTASTGNAVRGSYKAMPDISVSNFYIKPGEKGGAEKIMKEKGILINSMMGLHMTDTVSGNFSLGINGWLVENGEKIQPVKEVLITGNIREFLMNIRAIGDDLKFYFNFGSPTILAGDIMVAGK